MAHVKVSTMRDVFIVSAARMPVGRRNGYLRGWLVPELLGFVLDEVVRRIDAGTTEIMKSIIARSHGFEG